MQSEIKGKSIIIFPAGKITSDNAEIFENELTDIINRNQSLYPVLDMSELTYISSAGLRVLLKASKLYGKFGVINVSDEVYEVFSMTGFTALLDIEHHEDNNTDQMNDIAISEVDLSDYELISQNDLVSVYRTGDDRIIRVYDEQISLSYINSNKAKTEISLKAKIPVCITFNIVDCGGRYGIVYEDIKGAKPLLSVMYEDREHLASYASSLAKLTRTITSAEIRNTPLASAKATMRYMVSRLEVTGLLKPEEADKLKKVIINIPESQHYSHSYLTPSNILYNGGELIIMDSFMAATGHPIIDLSSIAWYFKLMPQYENTINTLFTPEENELIWKTYLKTYLNTENDALISKAEYQILQFSAVRYLLLATMLPGTVNESIVLKAKRTALSMSDVIEPLCF